MKFAGIALWMLAGSRNTDRTLRDPAEVPLRSFGDPNGMVVGPCSVSPLARRVDPFAAQCPAPFVGWLFSLRRLLVPLCAALAPPPLLASPPSWSIPLRVPRHVPRAPPARPLSRFVTRPANHRARANLPTDSGDDGGRRRRGVPATSLEKLLQCLPCFRHRQLRRPYAQYSKWYF